MESYTQTTPAATRGLASARVPGVTALVEMMVARDGMAYVGARYYGSYADAEVERVRYATRLRRDALRAVPRAILTIAALVAHTPRPPECPWCGGSVTEGVTLGGRRLHVACADQAMGVSAEPTEVAA